MDAPAEASPQARDAPPPGQLDGDEALELVAADERAPARAAVHGGLVSPAAELVEALAATLVARPQTQRTYERAQSALCAAGSARPAGPTT